MAASEAADAVTDSPRSWISHSASPPPMPPPPRLPAWNQPAARPFCSSGVLCAIRLSTAMPITVEAKFAATTNTVSTPSARPSLPNQPMASNPTTIVSKAAKYQPRRVHVRSTTGAHRNFQVCGT